MLTKRQKAQEVSSAVSHSIFTTRKQFYTVAQQESKVMLFHSAEERENRIHVCEMIAIN